MNDYLNEYIKGNLQTNQIGANGILAVNNERNLLPKARLPMVLNAEEERNTSGKTVVFQDMAGLSGEDADSARVLGILTTAWESGEHRLTNMRTVGAYIYSKWISRTITTRLGLTDFENLARMEILLALYFYACGRSANEVLRAPRTVSNIIEIVQSGHSLTTNTINEYINQFGDTDDITFERVMSIVTNLSPVFKQKVNATTIANCVANGWLGEAGVFHSQLALEYPPALFMGMYMAYVSKSGFKRTTFGTLIQKTLFSGKRSNQGEIFVRQLNDIIGTLTTTQ
jgi:hypothetical protein